MSNKTHNIANSDALIRQLTIVVTQTEIKQSLNIIGPTYYEHFDQ